MPLRVAVIGYGLAGSVFHAPLISCVPGLSVAAVVTGDPGRQENAARRYPAAAILGHAEQVWEDAGSYDLAVIAAPNRQHVPLATAALHAGLPVVADKPVATTAAAARGVAALAAARGLPVIPFHNRRWDGDFRTVRRLLSEGALGGPQQLESRFERWRPEIKPGWKESTDPRDAGSILYDLGPHLIDQALVLFGRPATVYAEIDTRRPGAAVPDDVFVALTHPGGVRSHLWMSATAAHLGPRFRVLGGAAGYVVYGLDGQEDALRAGRTPLDDGWGVAPAEAYGQAGTPGRTRAVPTEPGAYQDFYAAVADAVRGQAPPPVDLADAIAGLEVIEAAVRSAREQRVIDMPVPES
jgi:predicted dehydrogenase